MSVWGEISNLGGSFLPKGPEKKKNTGYKFVIYMKFNFPSPKGTVLWAHAAEPNQGDSKFITD